MTDTKKTDNILSIAPIGINRLSHPKAVSFSAISKLNGDNGNNDNMAVIDLPRADINPFNKFIIIHHHPLTFLFSLSI